jgi:hypothetical protein
VPGYFHLVPPGQSEKSPVVPQLFCSVILIVKHQVFEDEILVRLRMRPWAIGAEALSHLATPDRAGARPYHSQSEKVERPNWLDLAALDSAGRSKSA